VDLRVRADRVPRRHDRVDQPRVALDAVPDDEERRRRAEALELLERPRREDRIGAVVEGQGEAASAGRQALAHAAETQQVTQPESAGRS
jgi:hypothetical protein